MINALVISYSLVLAHVGSFVTLLPVLGGSQVPRLVKIGMTFALAGLWFGSVDQSVTKEFLDKTPQALWCMYGLALGREVILGAVLGYAFSMFLVPVRIAGEFIAEEMGLSMASLVDPLAENSSAVITQIFEMLGTVIFLGLDGHHLFLATLNSTFTRWPVGGSLFPVPLTHLVDGVASAQEWGMLLAAPIGICLFIASVVMAFMARAAPQMNIWSVGFALRVVVGLVAAVVVLPHLGTAMVAVFGHFSEWVLKLV